MKEELITSVSEILRDWNPVGEKAKSISDLEGYKYEAMDIISAIAISNVPVEKAVSEVLTQAFGITVSDAQLKQYSAQIEQLLRVQ